MVSAPDTCRHGHPYDETNTAYRTDGRRRCRACAAARSRRWYATVERPDPARRAHRNAQRQASRERARQAAAS
ncbi:hypothetical protein GCM10027261_14340 [Geodermatophilus arenarius]